MHFFFNFVHMRFTFSQHIFEGLSSVEIAPLTSEGSRVVGETIRCDGHRCRGSAQGPATNLLTNSGMVSIH